MDIASIHNIYERAVFDAVMARAHDFPHLRSDDDLLADIACVALNRLPARYIRHDADFSFFQTNHDRVESERAVQQAVAFAFQFVQARSANDARG